MNLTLPPITRGLWHFTKGTLGNPHRGFTLYVGSLHAAADHVIFGASGGPPEPVAEDSANVQACAAVPDLLGALLLAYEFLEDLRTSNPGYLRNLVLQDYSRLNRLDEIPAALKKAGCTETPTE